MDRKTFNSEVALMTEKCLFLVFHFLTPVFDWTMLSISSWHHASLLVNLMVSCPDSYHLEDIVVHSTPSWKTSTIQTRPPAVNQYPQWISSSQFLPAASMELQGSFYLQPKWTYWIAPDHNICIFKMLLKIIQLMIVKSLFEIFLNRTLSCVIFTPSSSMIERVP